MIRLLSKLVKWLESRFPEKVIVLESDYRELKSRVVELEITLAAHSDLVSRIELIESSAVHKAAVVDLVNLIAIMRDDLASFKTSIGFRTQASNDELQAVLNGEAINHGQE